MLVGLLLGLLAESVTPGQIWAPVVSAALVALIGGIVTVATTNHKKNEAADSAREAGQSKDEAEAIANLLQIKNDTIDSLERRVELLENEKKLIEGRCQDLADQIDELRESLRDASLLEAEFKRHMESEHHTPTGPENTSNG